MLPSAICIASHQGKFSCCRWPVWVIHLPTWTSQGRAESILQAPNPQQYLSTRLKKGLWISVRLSHSSHSHQTETECLAKVTTCFISLRPYGCPASEELRVSLRWPLIRNSQPCKPWELQGNKGLSSNAYGARITTYTISTPTWGWGQGPPCDLQLPREGPPGKSLGD